MHLNPCGAENSLLCVSSIYNDVQMWKSPPPTTQQQNTTPINIRGQSQPVSTTSSYFYYSVRIASHPPHPLLYVGCSGLNFGQWDSSMHRSLISIAPRCHSFPHSFSEFSVEICTWLLLHTRHIHWYMRISCTCTGLVVHVATASCKAIIKVKCWHCHTLVTLERHW